MSALTVEVCCAYVSGRTVPSIAGSHSTFRNQASVVFDGCA